VKEQRRGRAIAMSREEIDAYLREARTCRVATVGADGRPHVAPLWFAWDGVNIWLNSIVRSQRWADLVRDPRVSLVVDGGLQFHELHGVEISGRVAVVGDVPRGSEPHPQLAGPECLFARKYASSDTFVPDGRHAWLRIDVEKLVSWDFRKNLALRPAG
jgi:hypothetical protein